MHLECIWNVFERMGTHLNAFGCIWRRLDVFETFEIFGFLNRLLMALDVILQPKKFTAQYLHFYQTPSLQKPFLGGGVLEKAIQREQSPRIPKHMVQA